MSGPSVLDNTPWWMPGVTTGRADGLVLQRCTAYGDADAGPRHLEGGFYDLRSLGPHVWICKARADGQYIMHCRHGHAGQPQWLCNGHVMMIRKRGSGVCPACAHPPEEMALQERMERIRSDPANYQPDAVRREAAQAKAVSALWDIQAELNELVARGIVHRCPLTLTELS
jgi:hypothetical protein